MKITALGIEQTIALLQKDFSYRKIAQELKISYESVRNIAIANNLRRTKIGLASVSKELRVEIARMGGKKISSIPGQMSKIGKIGGRNLSRDLNHMSKIGKLGGHKVAQDRAHMSKIGKLGNLARKQSLK